MWIVYSEHNIHLYAKKNVICPYNINFIKNRGEMRWIICHFYTLIFSEIRIHVKCELSTVNTTYIYMQKNQDFKLNCLFKFMYEK